MQTWINSWIENMDQFQREDLDILRCIIGFRIYETHLYCYLNCSHSTNLDNISMLNMFVFIIHIEQFYLNVFTFEYYAFLRFCSTVKIQIQSKQAINEK